MWPDGEGGWGVSLTEAGVALCCQHWLSRWERGSDVMVAASVQHRVAAPQQAQKIPKKLGPPSGKRGGDQESGAVGNIAPLASVLPGRQQMLDQGRREGTWMGILRGDIV